MVGPLFHNSYVRHTQFVTGSTAYRLEDSLLPSGAHPNVWRICQQHNPLLANDHFPLLLQCLGLPISQTAMPQITGNILNS